MYVCENLLTFMFELKAELIDAVSWKNPMKLNVNRFSIKIQN